MIVYISRAQKKDFEPDPSPKKALKNPAFANGSYMFQNKTQKYSAIFKRLKLLVDIRWLISNYVSFVWTSIMELGTEISMEKFFGFLTFKFREKRFSSILKGLYEFS